MTTRRFVREVLAVRFATEGLVVTEQRIQEFGRSKLCESEMDVVSVFPTKPPSVGDVGSISKSTILVETAKRLSTM